MQSQSTKRIKLAERKFANDLKEKKILEGIVKTIMDRSREEWLIIAEECFAPLHGEDLQKMTKEEIIDHIHFYDIDYRSGQPVTSQ